MKRTWLHVVVQGQVIKDEGVKPLVDYSLYVPKGNTILGRKLRHGKIRIETNKQDVKVDHLWYKIKSSVMGV